jgi:hypothetical protein
MGGQVGCIRGCALATVAGVILMLPWLSNSVLRYATVLTLGWIALAALVVATSGTLAGDVVTSVPGPVISKAVQLDETNPCSNELIFLDARVVVTAASTVDSGVISTDGVVTLTGRMENGTARMYHNVAARQRFIINHAIELGPLEPTDVRLPLGDGAFLPLTLLAVRLQPTWGGSDTMLRITDVYLICALAPGSRNPLADRD